MSLMSLAGSHWPTDGPTLGGWLVEVTTQALAWIFLINLPMGILGMIMTFKIMPNQRKPTVKTFDLSGFIY
jgi:MFS family permease